MDQETVARDVRNQVAEVRNLARRLTPLERARFTRNLVRAVYDAVKFDPLFRGSLVGGPDRELDGLAPIGDAAEHWYDYLAQEQIEGPRSTD